MVQIVLTLRPPRTTEHTQLIAWRNENRRCFFDQREITLDQHLVWYSHQQKSLYDDFFVIENCEKNVIVGTIGLSWIPGLPGEYGRFLIANPYRGQGFGKKALYLLLRWGFDVRELSEIYGVVIASNGVAVNLDRSLGFIEEQIRRPISDKISYLVDVLRFTMKAEDLPLWESLFSSPDLDTVELPGAHMLSTIQKV